MMAPLRFENLDEETRTLMLREIDLDVATGGLYTSNYLNPQGQLAWPDLLREAASHGSDETLSKALEGLFRPQVERRKGDGHIMVNVPVTASQTLAQAQFNVYYMRALALRALERGGGERLVVYRGREALNPRPESEAMVGGSLEPSLVLEALRRTRGVIVEPSDLQIPMPNSGLTVRLVG